MMTFSDLYSSGLDRELAEESTQLFTKARRQDAVNRAQLAFVDLTECFVKRTTLSLTTGVSEYNLFAALTDFWRLVPPGVEVFHTNASSYTQYLSSLVERSVEWLNRYVPRWRGTTGGVLPQVYYLRPDSTALYLGFWPIHTTGTAVAQVTYLAKPPELSVSTQVPFGGRVDLEPYHQALIHGAAYELLKLKQDVEASQRQLALFDGFISRYRASKRRRMGYTISPLKVYWPRRRKTDPWVD